LDWIRDRDDVNADATNGRLDATRGASPDLASYLRSYLQYDTPQNLNRLLINIIIQASNQVSISKFWAHYVRTKTMTRLFDLVQLEARDYGIPREVEHGQRV
jgi:hypothetical protein